MTRTTASGTRPRANAPPVYRLLAANLDQSGDGGCELIFPNDDEAMDFARTMAREALCIQVWDGVRLVGLAYGKPR